MKVSTPFQHHPAPDISAKLPRARTGSRKKQVSIQCSRQQRYAHNLLLLSKRSVLGLVIQVVCLVVVFGLVG